MNPSLESFLRWTPRMLCLGFAIFLSLFALDAYQPGRTLGVFLPAFAIHLTPTFVLLAVLAVGWRWPKAAGVLLILGGIAYAVMTPAREHWSWVAVIAAPAWIIGALFLASPGRGVRIA